MAKRNTKNNKASVIAIVFVLLCVLLLIIFLLPEGNSQPGGNDVLDNLNGVENLSSKLVLSADTLPDATKDVEIVNETADTNILLNGDKVEIDGVGAEYDGKTLLINRPGVFSLKGKLDNSRILVNAKGEDIVLILDGVEVHCSDTAPLYVYNASSVTLLLNGTSVNKFSDGANYSFGYDFCSEVDGDPNATIYSKDDLIIRGTGTLTVEANYNNGITSKDELSIINTTVNVKAKDNGINGKDSLTITNSDITVDAGKDAIRSTQDADSSLGWIQITDSNITVSALADGIQAETAVSLNNSSVYIKTLGKADKNENLAESSSSKGIKVANGYLLVDGGNVLIDSADDSMNVTGDVMFANGNVTMSSGDEAVHSDNAILVNGGMIVITASNEGFEGKTVEVNGGEVYITAKDDGINTIGEYDDTNESKNIFEVQSDAYIAINGGKTVIDASGDGLDSNGNIYMTAGTLIVNGPENGGNGAIDYAGDFYLSGGTLVAGCAAGMAQAPDNATQNTLALNFGNMLSKGTCITVEGTDESFTFCLSKNAECVILSSPMLKSGETYTVSYNGKYSGGSVTDGICSDGKVTGAKKLGEVTINDYLTSYGSFGIGGSHGGQMFGNPDGFGGHKGEGKQPPEGGFPQGPMGRPNGDMGMPNGDMGMPNGEPPEVPIG